MTNAALRGKPDAGNPHVRFDEGEVAPAATPRRGSLLYKEVKKSTKSIHRQWKKCQKLPSGKAANSEMMDEEVAANVSRLIWKTAHLSPCEQAEKLADKVTFWWMILTDRWPVSDIANRLVSDEAAAKELLCERFIMPHLRKSDDANILASRIREGKFIHFQLTKAFSGGFDAYIVFRLPKSADAVIIRLEYA